ncbi:MAG: putative bifunctional diguanylate cyclase/phosphodiesterase [Candidatus Dormibacteria bacterium]
MGVELLDLTDRRTPTARVPSPLWRWIRLRFQTAGGSRPMIARVWAYNALLTLGAVLLFVFGVSRQAATWHSFHLPWAVLAAAFVAVSASRVYIHFRRNAQAYALSEIPLVVGLFFCTPDELLLARVLGSAIGLGVICRQPPIKLAFNLASFAIETEVALLLAARLLPNGAPLGAGSWLAVLLIALIVSAIGFLLSAIVITLAEERLERRRWQLPAALAIGGGLANASLGALIVTTVLRSPLEVLFLALPLFIVGAAYALYTREYQKRQQLQYLYQSSDLLQRSTEQGAAIPELLRQLCSVFRTEVAQIVLLPVGGSLEHASQVVVQNGAVSEKRGSPELEFLERFAPLLESERRTFLAVPPRVSPAVAGWLHESGLRNAIGTALQSESTLLGLLVVGNRLSDVSVFDGDDLPLLETFAAQASAAVQNTRLGNRLEHQAFHDPLTGLANRALFTDRLEHALQRRDGKSEQVAVVFLDLDDFKIVNDTLGHAAGDELLCAVGRRLQSVLRPADTAARFGGDEFAVLIEETGEQYSVVGVAQRILGVLAPTFAVSEREVTLRASLGVALAANADSTAAELLRRADVAMYRAKTRGKGTFEVFEPGMQAAITQRLETRTELERALREEQLTVYYQPVIDLKTNEPLGVEALVRWEHPERGLVNPAEFVGVAEESGLIHEMGLQVLREACRQCQAWQAAFPDLAAFSVSVNVSPRQLSNQNFVADVWDALTRSGLHPSRLVLEITESFMADDPENARQLLQRLKATGVRISLDDFGTGYSSLSALQDLPIDILKIDRAFIDHMVDDPRRGAFVQAIVRLGKTLGLGLVAEGVETHAQAERLLALGCFEAQGFYFSRPEPAHVITRLLRRTAASGVEWREQSDGGAHGTGGRIIGIARPEPRETPVIADDAAAM